MGERPRFDVLVLGGGSAGCALAGRLREASGRTVCLVEAIPTIPRANTNLTTIAIAERIAELLS